MISNTQLIQMRQVEESVMASSAVVYRMSYVSDGMMGFNESWTAVGTVVCDVWTHTQGSETQNNNIELSQQKYYITLPHSTDIRVDDRIDVESKTYLITTVPNKLSLLTALRCEAINYNQEQR